MFTVKSVPPATNSRVPSSGSTRKKASSSRGCSPRLMASSAITGTPGAHRASASTIISSASRSAAVTGLESVFLSTVNPVRRWRMMAAPAASAGPSIRLASLLGFRSMSRPSVSQLAGEPSRSSKVPQLSHQNPIPRKCGQPAPARRSDLGNDVAAHVSTLKSQFARRQSARVSASPRMGYKTISG